MFRSILFPMILILASTNVYSSNQDYSSIINNFITKVNLNKSKVQIKSSVEMELFKAYERNNRYSKFSYNLESPLRDSARIYYGAGYDLSNNSTYLLDKIRLPRRPYSPVPSTHSNFSGADFKWEDIEINYNYIGLKISGGGFVPTINKEVLFDDTEPIYGEFDYGDFLQGEFGIFFRNRLGMTSKIFLEIDASYIRKNNYVVSSSTIVENGMTIERSDEELNNFSYIQTPVLVKFPLGNVHPIKGWYLSLGAYAGYLLKTKGKVNREDIVTENGVQTIRKTQLAVDYLNEKEFPLVDGKSPINKWDYGVIGEIEYATAGYGEFGFRYYHGLNNLNNQDYWDSSNSKSNLEFSQVSLFIYFNYRIGL